MTRRDCLAAAGYTSLLTAVTPASGQESRAQDEARAQQHEERGVMSPGSKPPPRFSVSAARFHDGPQSVQVNVTPQGLNIIGDAANEPSIVVDPTAPNRMAIGWRQFDTIHSNFRQAGNAWTNDGGRTWHVNPPLTPGVFRSDPCLDAASDGTFYFYSLELDFTCDLFHSTDGGRIWSTPRTAPGGDKNWMVVSRSGGLGDGNVYLNAVGNPFCRSTDRGVSFRCVSLPNTPAFGTMAAGPDGEFYLADYPTNQGSLVHKSLNARDPFATPVFTSVNAPMGGPGLAFTGPNPGGWCGQVWIDVDRSSTPARGHVFMLCSIDPAGSDPLDVLFVRSIDGGQTWSAPKRVNDDSPGNGAWQWFGTMSVASNGRIDAIWNDGRNSGGNLRLSELFYSFSADGGQTWAPNQRISPQWDSHLGWPAQNKIGDYYHMRSDLVGADLAWAATFNGEQDVYYLRIGDRDCNQNGIGDAQDLTNGFAQDCNTNTIPDSCEIAAGAVADANNNGIPDPCECYPDCDPSTGPRVLDIFDLLCFQNRYDAQDPYACDCDVSTGPGVCDVFDFLCFQNAYDAGCR